MSKKIAEGALHLVIDLKIGSGAFMPNIRKANKLAHLLLNTERALVRRSELFFPI